MCLRGSEIKSLLLTLKITHHGLRETNGFIPQIKTVDILPTPTHVDILPTPTWTSFPLPSTWTVRLFIESIVSLIYSLHSKPASKMNKMNQEHTSLVAFRINQSPIIELQSLLDFGSSHGFSDYICHHGLDLSESTGMSLSKVLKSRGVDVDRLSSPCWSDLFVHAPMHAWLISWHASPWQD